MGNLAHQMRCGNALVRLRQFRGGGILQGDPASGRLLGGQRETKRIRRKRKRSRRWPLGSSEPGSRRFASERTRNSRSKFKSGGKTSGFFSSPPAVCIRRT